MYRGESDYHRAKTKQTHHRLMHIPIIRNIEWLRDLAPIVNKIRRSKITILYQPQNSCKFLMLNFKLVSIDIIAKLLIKNSKLYFNPSAFTFILYPFTFNLLPLSFCPTPCIPSSRPFLTITTSQPHSIQVSQPFTFILSPFTLCLSPLSFNL